MLQILIKPQYFNLLIVASFYFCIIISHTRCPSYQPLIFYNICIESCPINSYNNYGICICKVGYAKYAGGCSNICPIPNQIMVINSSDNYCTCPYYDIGGVCIMNCPDHSSPSFPYKICICDDGYVANSYTGLCEDQCPENFISDSSRICICTDGYDFLGTCLNLCPLNSITINDPPRCICNKNFTYFNGKCVLNCPINTYSNNDTYFPQCIYFAIIFLPQISNISTTSCPINAKMNIDDQICYCNQEYFKMSFYCLSACPPYYIANENICTCSKGYYEFFGQCVKNCPPNSKLINNTNKCICNNNFAFYNRQCILNCKFGMISSNNISICLCPLGMGLFYSQCTFCPLGSDPIGVPTICRCLNNLIFFNGKCTDFCPGNMININQSGVCQCPNNTYFSEQDQYCISSCPDGYFKNEFFVCTICDNSCKTCFEESSQNCLSCISPNRLTPSNSCNETCPIGYFPNAINNCQNCSESCYECMGPYNIDCTSCQSPYILNPDSSCTISCQNNFVDNGNGTCTAIVSDSITMLKTGVIVGVTGLFLIIISNSFIVIEINSIIVAIIIIKIIRRRHANNINRNVNQNDGLNNNDNNINVNNINVNVPEQVNRIIKYAPVLLEPPSLINVNMQSEDKKCQICLENISNVKLIPCGHEELCESCVKKIIALNFECPYCRRSIISYELTLPL